MLFHRRSLLWLDSANVTFSVTRLTLHFTLHPTTATKCNEQPSHSKPPRWKSMLIHQGWFSAPYTLHLLASLTFEFLICSTLDTAHNTLHQRIVPREAIPSYYFSLRKDSPIVLARGLHGYGNSGLAVVIIPPLPPNVTSSRAES